MEKLEKILKNYLNKGSYRIDITMVLSLIDQCKKDDNKQLLLHDVVVPKGTLCECDDEDDTIPMRWICTKCKKEWKP